ncbi:MAG: Rnf-Nqr domain containing protein, partial [Methylohalobius sp.]
MSDEVLEAEEFKFEKIKPVLVDPLIDNNPIILQVLGICSALAVTSQMATALIM